VTLAFALSGDTVTAVTLAAVGGPSWSLGEAFPALAPTILGSLRLAAPTLTMDSSTVDPANPETPAIALRAHLVGSGGMAAIGLLLPGATHPVTGTIAMSATTTDFAVATPLVPTVLLNGPEGQSLNLGLFTVTELRYEFYGVPRLNYATLDNEVAGMLIISG